MGCINTEKPGSLARFLPRFLREQTYHSYAPCASSVAQLLSLGSNREQDCAEVSLVFWTGVFLSPGRRIRVTGKETGPGPGGYG